MGDPRACPQKSPFCPNETAVTKAPRDQLVAKAALLTATSGVSLPCVISGMFALSSSYITMGHCQRVIFHILLPTRLQIGCTTVNGRPFCPLAGAAEMRVCGVQVSAAHLYQLRHTGQSPPKCIHIKR
jgi:hypothetical protein